MPCDHSFPPASRIGMVKAHGVQHAYVAIGACSIRTTLQRDRHMQHCAMLLLFGLGGPQSAFAEDNKPVQEVLCIHCNIPCACL